MTRRLVVTLLALPIAATAFSEGAKNYVFFSQDRERIHEASFLDTRAFVGAQVTYTWRRLEPAPNKYDFSAIRSDLAFLSSRHKRLFVQLQDVTFAPSLINAPKYLQTDPKFHGGVAPQYDITDNDEVHAKPAGWVARRWDPVVRKRFQRLLTALGKAFDGKIEGINLPETAVDFGETGRLYPKDFTSAKYRDAIVEDMAALKRSFPRSTTMQYANFMPGEWLPDDDKGYLRSVYSAAERLHVGVGGPDLLPTRPAQLHHSYPLIRAAHGKTRTGIAVQDGNYGLKDPRSGISQTIASLVKFANGFLKVDYIFWCTEEPYYSKELIPALARTRPITPGPKNH